MARIFGIDFAPLWIPLDRRLQTLAVFQFISMFLGYGFLCVFINYYIYFHTRFWWLAVLYFVWYVIDQPKVHKGGRRHLLAIGKYIGLFAVRKWRVWNYFRDYFPIRLIKTADLDPSRSYLFGYHPHGIVSVGAFCSFVTDAAGFHRLYPGLTAHLLTLRCWFFFPLLREVLLFGGLSVASRQNIDSLLLRQSTVGQISQKSGLQSSGTPRVGKAVVLVVGGAQEALYASPGTRTLVLAKRFGFIKKSLQHGVPLVPCFAFGENDLFSQNVAAPGSWTRKIQDFLRKMFSFSTPMFWGRGIFNYSFGVLPRRVPVTVVVGAPVEPEGGVAHGVPTTEQIQKHHAKYAEALVELFERHKLEYGLGETDHLEII